MIGFLRPGLRLPTKSDPYDGKDIQPCSGTWYEVEPTGFVCEGKLGVTSKLDDPRVAAASSWPALDGPMPFSYASSFGTPLYARLPSTEEQRQVEGNVEAWRTRAEALRAKLPPEKRPPELALPVGQVPAFLQKRELSPILLAGFEKARGVRGGFADGTRKLALVHAFESEGRTFYVTSEHFIVPADRLTPARPSAFAGTLIAELEKPGVHLPVVWVRLSKTPAVVYELSDEVMHKTSASLPYHAYAEVLKDDVVQKSVRFHELKKAPDGLDAAKRYFVRAPEATRLDSVTSLPKSIEQNDIWVDINLSKQTLVLYKGMSPLFATLISSGSGTKGHVTPWGSYRVYQKHRSSRMSAPGRPSEGEGDPGDRPYTYDEVPYVQYLVGGVAIHTAWWHDGFGTPRSHGCINVSPTDAKYLFEQMDPKLPEGWHGMAPGRAGLPNGSWVVIHG